MQNHMPRTAGVRPSTDAIKALEYKARRALDASTAAIEATRRGTPSHKAKTWRMGQSPAHYDR